MDYGFAWFTRGPLASADGLRTLAVTGERLGYAYMVVPDHVVIPTEIDSTYPYSADGSFPGSGLGECMDVLTAIAYASAVTEKLRMLTSVMVVPHRPALLTAKIIATIDQLSGGRITVGCGAGWMAEEFKALQLPDYAERGEVTNEYLEVFKEVWTNELASFNGRYVRFENVSTRPLPVQKPHPPLWIGGESAPALKRVVSHGDGWYPIGNNPRFPLDTAERIARRLERLKGFADDADRDMGSIDLAYWSHWNTIGDEVKNSDGARMILTGSASAVADDIAMLKEAGFNHLMLNMTGRDLEESTARMAQFMTDVRPEAS
ncbi:TIGR03619 family F420-dependent LLM class oxidoreductase [Minwuia sp.]|uniref:TIGR03619 family F420-dependent LLM class oxidoreductase n=1 Tax=Minwuia sp. TaxID=2493630 RepID=UPI003A955953